MGREGVQYTFNTPNGDWTSGPSVQRNHTEYLRFVWNVDILAGRQDDTWRLNYLFVDLFKMCYLLIYTISTHASTVSALIYGVSRAIWHFEIGLDLLSEDHFCTFFVTRWDLVQLLTFI